MLSALLTLGMLLQSISALQFSETEFDFGLNPKTVRELVHEFSFTNASADTVSLSYALATCPCTKLSWTTAPIPPGGGGSVTVTYAQERFIHSFSKKVSVFVNGGDKPYKLNVSGKFYDTRETLLEAFPVQRADVAFENDYIAADRVSPGRLAYLSLSCANLSAQDTHTITLISGSDGLELSARPWTLEPLSYGAVNFSFTVDSLAWGERAFTVIPVLDEEPLEPLRLEAMVIDDFNGVDAATAPDPLLLTPTLIFPTSPRGQDVETSFTVRNRSAESPLILRAVYSDTPGVEPRAPASVPPGGEADIPVSISAGALQAGRNGFMIKVVCNSPLRPVLEQVIKGVVE